MSVRELSPLRNTVLEPTENHCRRLSESVLRRQQRKAKLGEGCLSSVRYGELAASVEGRRLVIVKVQWS